MSSWECSLVVSDKLDAQDKKGKWFESIVTQVEGTRVKVHYFGWDNKFDEWIPVPSDRLAPRFKQVKEWRSTLCEYDLVDICHVSTKRLWMPALVLAIGTGEMYGMLQYTTSTGSKYWIDVSDENMEPYRSHTSGHSSELLRLQAEYKANEKASRTLSLRAPVRGSSNDYRDDNSVYEPVSKTNVLYSGLVTSSSASSSSSSSSSTSCSSSSAYASASSSSPSSPSSPAKMLADVSPPSRLVSTSQPPQSQPQPQSQLQPQPQPQPQLELDTITTQDVLLRRRLLSNGTDDSKRGSSEVVEARRPPPPVPRPRVASAMLPEAVAPLDDQRQSRLSLRADSPLDLEESIRELRAQHQAQLVAERRRGDQLQHQLEEFRAERDERMAFEQQHRERLFAECADMEAQRDAELHAKLEALQLVQQMRRDMDARAQELLASERQQQQRADALNGQLEMERRNAEFAGQHMQEEMQKEIRRQKEQLLEICNCPLSLELLQDPVSCLCGHSFERRSIVLWLAKQQCCPISKDPLQVQDLRPNRILMDIIEHLSNGV